MAENDPTKIGLWTKLKRRCGLEKPQAANHGIAIPKPSDDDRKWARQLLAKSAHSDAVEIELLGAVQDQNIWRVNHILSLPPKYLFLWERKIDPTVTISRGFFDFSPLLLAAEKGATDIARLLIHHGCDPNQTLDAGLAPLHLAAWKGHQETAAALVASGASINKQAANGQTALMLAAWNGYYKLGEMLIDLGAHPNIKTEDGKTALHIAAQTGKGNFIRRLAAKGCDVNARTEKGETPLMQAIVRGHLGAVTALLDQGADANIACRDGDTALTLAVVNNRIDILHALLAARKFPSEETATLLQSTPSPVIAAMLDAHQLHQHGGWKVTATDEIRHITLDPANGIRLTDIFNFTKQERLLISSNPGSGGETMLKESFADIAGTPVLDEARKRLDNARSAARPAPY